MLPAGPFLLGAVWLTILVAIVARNVDAGRRGAPHVSWIEVVPFVVAVVMIQLLLDLHTPHLGDAVAAALHLAAVAIWIIYRLATR